MIKGLHAGGLPAVRSQSRDRLGKRLSRANYEPNPNGELWEPDLEDVTELGFPRQYDRCVIKIFATWLPCVAVHPCRAVFMMRDPKEVLKSMREAKIRHPMERAWWLGLLERSRCTEQFIGQEQQEGLAWLGDRRSVKSWGIVTPDQLLNNPRGVFSALQQDGWPIDPIAASRIVEPRMKRSVA